MIFYSRTISLLGEPQALWTHDSDRLVQSAVEVFRPLVGLAGVKRWPVPGAWRGFEIEWTIEFGAALVSFYFRGSGLTFAALLTGSSSGDCASLSVLQKVVATFAPLFEIPTDDLTRYAERPLLLTIALPPVAPLHFDPEASRAVLPIVADMEVCLAAAYFTSP